MLVWHLPLLRKFITIHRWLNLPHLCFIISKTDINMLSISCMIASNDMQAIYSILD